MDRPLQMLTFDVGNSGVRALLCTYDGKQIKSQTVLNETNEMIQIGRFYYWDILRIFSIMKRAVYEASKISHIDSIGICTWGVDFCLLDENNNILGNTFSYRNTIGGEQMDLLNEDEIHEMYSRTGILTDKINSIFMIKGMQKYCPAIMGAAKKILMVPDIFAFLFTGELVNEPSELSTTQMLDVVNMTISPEQCRYAGVSPDLFSKIGEHGKRIGYLRPEILEELNIDYEIPFICVPSHDTASAVMAIPSAEEEYLFISAGTWALIGAQVSGPIVTKEVEDANLTNEHGAFGRTTILRNSIGMYLTQRLKAEYELEIKAKIGWTEFTALSEKFNTDPLLFDVNDIRFFNPKHMAEEIQKAIHPDTDGKNIIWGEILASTYASLGESYAQNLRMVQKCIGKTYDRAYIVGGGAKNAIINRRCADSLGIEIITCEQESSSIGNAVSQIAYFHPEYSYHRLREIIVNSMETKHLMPNKADN